MAAETTWEAFLSSKSVDSLNQYSQYLSKVFQFRILLCKDKSDHESKACCCKELQSIAWASNCV